MDIIGHMVTAVLPEMLAYTDMSGLGAITGVAMGVQCVTPIILKCLEI